MVTKEEGSPVDSDPAIIVLTNQWAKHVKKLFDIIPIVRPHHLLNPLQIGGINNKILRNPSRLFVILEASDLIQTYSDRCICRV